MMTVPEDLPGNGLLSGMVLTWGTALVLVPLGLFHGPTIALLDHPPSNALIDVFGLSILVMVLHKVESWITGEFDACPVYLTTGRARWAKNVREAQFTMFVATFLGMLILVWLAFKGGHWPMLMLGIWIAQGQHELHHTAKSLSRRRYYPGTATGLVFVATIALGVFPTWCDILGIGAAWRAAFLGAMPVTLLAFYLEDRWWIGRAGSFGQSLVGPTT